MEVVKYQLIIIVSISLAFLIFGRKPAFYLSIFWTLWTVVLLFHPPLIFTQLAFTWGSYLICRQLSENRRKIKELEACSSEYGDDFRKRILAAGHESAFEVVDGREHWKELKHAITSARNEVVILSGWISSNVLDRDLLQLIERRIRDGVTFFFGYGWRNSKGEHAGFESTDSAIQALKRLTLKHPENIFIHSFPNHEKLLIKDRDYVICGSNNWLSNRGFRNSERSVKIFSTHLAATETERIKRMVQPVGRGNE